MGGWRLPCFQVSVLTYRIGPITTNLLIAAFCGAALLLAGCEDEKTNNPPTISGDPPIQVQEDTPYNFKPTAKDPEGDTLTFSITNKPSWASFDPASGRLSGTPGNEDVGTTKGIVITVADSAGGKASLPSFDLTVTNVNDAPVVTKDQKFNVEENSAVGTVVGTVEATDVDSPVTGFAITGGNTDGAFAVGSDGQLTVANSTVLDYETPPTTINLKVTASDGSATSGAETVVIEITNVNEPPVAAGSCSTAKQGSTIPGVLGASDPDAGDTLRFSLGADGSYGEGPMPTANGGSVRITDNSTGAYQYTPKPNRGGRGRDTFAYQVTDSGGATATGTETVIVELKIMPLGDSITAGVVDADDTPAIPWRTGYRKPLYQRLNDEGGYKVDFVGRLNQGCSAGYDPHAEGWSGFTAEQLAGSVPGPARKLCNGTQVSFSGIQDELNSYPADIILLHIGTNDVGGTSAADIASILDDIDAWEDSANGNPVTVLLAKIIGSWRVGCSGSFSTCGNPAVTALNNEIATMVANRNDDVILVDQFGALSYPADLGDQSRTSGYRVHPNSSGYTKMAKRWYSKLTGLLEKCP